MKAGRGGRGYARRMDPWTILPRWILAGEEGRLFATIDTDPPLTAAEIGTLAHAVSSASVDGDIAEIVLVVGPTPLAPPECWIGFYQVVETIGTIAQDAGISFRITR